MFGRGCGQLDIDIFTQQMERSSSIAELPACIQRLSKTGCEKCRKLQGYNHQTFGWLIGPGHFTIRQDGDEVLFDYTAEPNQGFPECRH